MLDTDAPRHPYTLGLLASLPRMDVETDALNPIPGNPPSGAAQVGCAFSPRCPLARERCREERPELLDVGGGRRSACHFHEELVGVAPEQLYSPETEEVR